MPYVIKKTEVLQELERVPKKLFIWFTENKMMANADKFHLLLSFVEGHANEIDGFSVKNARCKKLLGVHFDEQLNFDSHI